ncbi:MAG: O-methyltransferase [Eubacteriales bacterium]|nr:O-methyltransferase [Eubacteriales bacterium]
MNRDRIADYLSSLEPETDELLDEMRTFAVTHDVPIVRLETESFLRTMVHLTHPKRILEIGTAIAYSTIVMAREALSLNGQAFVLTIESWERRIPLAQENIRRAGLSDHVELVHADAGAVLREQALRKKAGDLPEEAGYDLVFLDAAKGQYLHWLPDILCLMRQGALLIADNVMQDGTVMESRFTIPRRDRTTHSRMREFLYEIKHHPELESSVLPLGDGVSISVKK